MQVGEGESDCDAQWRLARWLHDHSEEGRIVFSPGVWAWGLKWPWAGSEYRDYDTFFPEGNTMMSVSPGFKIVFEVRSVWVHSSCFRFELMAHCRAHEAADPVLLTQIAKRYGPWRCMRP